LIDEIGSPVQASRLQKLRCEPRVSAFGEYRVDQLLRRRIRRGAECVRDWTEREIEQAISPSRLQIIVPFGCRRRNQLDLPLIEPKACVGLTGLRLDGALIG
jgi:hypothetical protein